MKNYQKPQINTISLSNEDILSGSDVLIDGTDLFREADGE